MRNAGDEFLEKLALFGSKLLDDVREKVFDGLGFRFSTDDEGIVLDGGIGFGILEVEDGIVISEEVDLVDAERVCANLLDDGLDDLVVAGLDIDTSTDVLLTTFTFLRWDPLPPVRASPTLFLSFSILAWIYSWLSSIGYHNF